MGYVLESYTDAVMTSPMTSGRIVSTMLNSPLPSPPGTTPIRCYIYYGLFLLFVLCG